MKKVIHLLNRAVCLLMVVSLLFCSFGCAGKGSSKLSVAENAEPIKFASGNAGVHYASPQFFKDIAASGLITLMFDETSSAIGVRIDNGDDKSSVWSALPVAGDMKDSTEADVVSLEVVHNSALYHLNSQDNSVAVERAFWGNIDNGFRVIYFITDSPEKLSDIGPDTADDICSTAAGENILYKVIVEYILKDGCLYVDLKWKNLGNDKDVLVNIGFLEYFGAAASSVQGDFILVPDGSGALIDTASFAEIEPVTIPVYGNDLGGSSQLSAIVPAYGMKSGDAAFAAVIEKGDAVASITANKANSGSDFNRVGAQFIVTPSQVDDGERRFSQISYSGEIGLSYRFLNGSDATYGGLAAACREQLVRNYTLSTRSVEESEYLPVMINVIGRADKGGFFALPKNLTTFDEAQDLLNRIKSKGVNNAYLRYSGALSGGLDASDAGDAKPLTGLGGNSALRELNDYAATLNFNVFVDIAVLTDAVSSSSTTGDLLSSGAAFDFKNILNITGFAEGVLHRHALKSSSFEKTVLSVLEKFDGFDSTGYCVFDAGQFLYTDYATETDRQAVRNLVNEKIQPLSAQSLVMVEKGNFYTLKTADVISGIPETCGRSEADGYTAVPFVQIILHGIIDYSGSPINTAQDKTTAFLRCVEYGMLPSFVLTNDSLVDSKEYSAIFSGDEWLNIIYSNYNSFNSVMGDLHTSRITNHYKVAEGVFCTEYESTTRIYVNYTNEPVTVSGITVEPMNYFRVN